MTENNQNLNACAPAKFCPGCGHPIVLMMLNKVLDDLNLRKQAVLGLDIGCSLLAWNFLPVNTFQTHHGRVTPTIMGYKKASSEKKCFGYTGDGGAYAIGLQYLIHAARRDDPITMIIVNNTVYAMTGGQTAPTTMKGQVTDTSLNGPVEEPFFGIELLRQVAKPEAFLARTAVNDPKTCQEYLKEAIATQQKGHFSAVEFLSMCPTNWRTRGADTIKFLEGMKEIFKLGKI